MNRLVSWTVAATALACGACVVHVPKKVDLAVQVAGHPAAAEDARGSGEGLWFVVEPPRDGDGRLRVRWRPSGAVVVIDALDRGHRLEAPGPGRWHVLEFDPSASDGALTLWLDARPDGTGARRRLRVPGRVGPAGDQGEGVGLGVVPAGAASGRTTLRLRAGGRCLEIDLAPARTVLARRRSDTSGPGVAEFGPGTATTQGRGFHPQVPRREGLGLGLAAASLGEDARHRGCERPVRVTASCESCPTLVAAIAAKGASSPARS